MLCIRGATAHIRARAHTHVCVALIALYAHQSRTFFCGGRLFLGVHGFCRGWD